MTTSQNHRRCPASGCAVVVFDLVYRISGIGDDSAHRQVETDSDNFYLSGRESARMLVPTVQAGRLLGQTRNRPAGGFGSCGAIVSRKATLGRTRKSHHKKGGI